jgi:hypothetical protein
MNQQETVPTEFAMELARRVDELEYENAQLRATTTGFVTADYAAQLEDQIAHLMAEVAELRAQIGDMDVDVPETPRGIPMNIDVEPQTPRGIPMDIDVEPQTPRVAMQIDTDPDNESRPDWTEPQTPRQRTMV